MTIRDVPDETRDRLADRADRAGQSLQEYMRATLIELAARETTAEALKAVRAQVRDGRSRATGDDAVRVLRELRDGS